MQKNALFWHNNDHFLILTKGRDVETFSLYAILSPGLLKINCKALEKCKIWLLNHTPLHPLNNRPPRTKLKLKIKISIIWKIYKSSSIYCYWHGHNLWVSLFIQLEGREKEGRDRYLASFKFYFIRVKYVG